MSKGNEMITEEIIWKVLITAFILLGVASLLIDSSKEDTPPAISKVICILGLSSLATIPVCLIAFVWIS